MSENPLVASDLLLGGHVTGTTAILKNLNSARHKCWLQLVRVKSRVNKYMVFGVGQLIGDVKFDV